MRLFLALNLPEAVREAVFAAAAPLRLAAPDLAWVPAERLHLTVKFLGERPESDVEPLVTGVGPAVARTRELSVALGGVGAFPRMRRPRVLWLGVQPDPRLELLHHDVEAACAALGHAVEGRPFRPHLTLARVPPRAEPLDAAPLAAAARQVHYRAEVAVHSVDLMLSEPAARGVRYSALARLPFASPSHGS